MRLKKELLIGYNLVKKFSQNEPDMQNNQNLIVGAYFQPRNVSFQAKFIT